MKNVLFCHDSLQFFQLFFGFFNTIHKNLLNSKNHEKNVSSVDLLA